MSTPILHVAKLSGKWPTTLVLLGSICLSACANNATMAAGHYGRLTTASMETLEPASSIAYRICLHQGEVAIAQRAIDERPLVERTSLVDRCRATAEVHRIQQWSLVLIAGYAEALKAMSDGMTSTPDASKLRRIAEVLANLGHSRGDGQAAPTNLSTAATAIAAPAQRLADIFHEYETIGDLQYAVHESHDPVMQLMTALREYVQTIGTSIPELQIESEDLEGSVLKQLAGHPVETLDTVDRFSVRSAQLQRWEDIFEGYDEITRLLASIQVDFHKISSQPDDEEVLASFYGKLERLHSVMERTKPLVDVELRVTR